MSPALEIYNDLMNATPQFKHKKETPWASLGHFLRSEVCHLLTTEMFILVTRSQRILMITRHKVWSYVCLMYRDDGEQQSDVRKKMQPPDSCYYVPLMPC